MIECVEIHASGFKVDGPSPQPLLCALLDVPIGLGLVIRDDRFVLGTIHEM